MKKLLVLLIVWLGLTVKLGIDNLKYQEDSDDQLNRRAFIVYSRTLVGCMVGASFSNPNYKFTSTYLFCRDTAFREKDIYLGPKKQ